MDHTWHFRTHKFIPKNQQNSGYFYTGNFTHKNITSVPSFFIYETLFTKMSHLAHHFSICEISFLKISHLVHQFLYMYMYVPVKNVTIDLFVRNEASSTKYIPNLHVFGEWIYIYTKMSRMVHHTYGPNNSLCSFFEDPKSHLPASRACIFFQMSIMANGAQKAIFLSMGGWNSYSMVLAAQENAHKSQNLLYHMSLNYMYLLTYSKPQERNFVAKFRWRY